MSNRDNKSALTFNLPALGAIFVVYSDNLSAKLVKLGWPRIGAEENAPLSCLKLSFANSSHLNKTPSLVSLCSEAQILAKL